MGWGLLGWRSRETPPSPLSIIPGVPWAVSPPGTPQAPGPGSKLGLGVKMGEGKGPRSPKMGLGRDRLGTAEHGQDTTVTTPLTLPFPGTLINSQPLIN